MAIPAVVGAIGRAVLGWRSWGLRAGIWLTEPLGGGSDSGGGSNNGVPPGVVPPENSPPGPHPWRPRTEPEASPPPHGPWTPPGRFPDPRPDSDLDNKLPLHCSPLILDLDGDGVEAGAAVFFDHEGDGFMELTRWADEGDGVLAAGGGRKSPFCPPKLTFVPAAAQFA